MIGVDTCQAPPPRTAIVAASRRRPRARCTRVRWWPRSAAGSTPAPPAALPKNLPSAGALASGGGAIVSQTLKLLLGVGDPLVGRYLTFDALDMEFREYKIRKDPNNQVTWENRDQIQVVELEGLCQPAPLQAPANA